VAVALAPALSPAQPAAADPASIGGPVSTAAGAATDTETGVKQALAAAHASPRVPAAGSLQRDHVFAMAGAPDVSVVPPAGSGARHAGTVLPALPAPDAVRGAEAFDA
jgi:hypothetical protein